MSTTTTDQDRQKRIRIVIWVVVALIVVGVAVGLIVTNLTRDSGDPTVGGTPTSQDAPAGSGSQLPQDAASLPAQNPQASADPNLLARENSVMLDTNANSQVQIVEFLDFECEACGAFYPVMEEFRASNAENIDYVVRYFPLPSHLNSMNAAIAAESANQQGQFEDMYNQLFTTQVEWGESQESQAPLFRSYAEEIGLDMAAYDQAVADPATQARIQADIDDGIALGVDSTPTFFINGQVADFEGIQTAQDVLDYFNGFLE